MRLRTLLSWMLGLILCGAEAALEARTPVDVRRPYSAQTQTSEAGDREQDERRDGDPDEDEDEDEEEDEIETDRDSFTPATTTAGAHRLILESSYSFLDNRDTFETHSFPEFLARRGVTDWFELRLGWNYEIGGEGATDSSSGLGGEFDSDHLVEDHNISYGAKVALTRQNSWTPKSALIVQAFTPTGGPSSDTQLVATYVWGWQFSNGWLLDSSIRYGTASEAKDHGNQWAPSVVLKVPVGRRWKAHVEYFGIFMSGLKRDRAPQYFSPGLHYLITSNVEIGVRVGWGLSNDAANFFSNAGVGLRF